MLEFGKPKRVITEPGLQYKIPFIQNVVFFDKRILDIDTASQEVIASDQKRLVVDAFARYKIVNPLLFFQSVANEQGANSRLGALLESSLRRVLGGASFATVVRDKREELMRTILSQVNKEAGPFGINVVDVRIKRVDLPEANMQAIYRRMQTERQRQAAEFRAEGEGASRRIRGTADREVTVIKADATGESVAHPGQWRCREEPHLRRGLRPGSGLLRLLPLDAGLRGGAQAGRYPAPAEPGFAVLPIFQQRHRQARGGRHLRRRPRPSLPRRLTRRRPTRMARRPSRARPRAMPRSLERDISAGEAPSPAPQAP